MVRVVTGATTYVTEDGKVFNTRREADQHEEATIGKDELKYRHYTQTSYGGRRVVEQYGLAHYGTWEILGEDDNPDLGGYHSQPSLGIYEGTLEQVIRKAITIPRFYSWGGGGSIKLHTIEKIEKL